MKRTQKKVSIAALVCWLISIVYLTISMTIKLIKGQDALYELLHLLLIITVFFIISKDWKQASPWHDYKNNPIADKSFGKRIKRYLSGSLLYCLIFATLDLILRTINENLAFIKIEAEKNFYNILGSFLIEALFLFIIFFIFTLVISESKLIRYKKQLRKIEKEEQAEKENHT